MTSCPPSAILAQLFAGTLAPDQVRSLKEHLSGCPHCRGRFGHLSESTHPHDWPTRIDPSSSESASPSLLAQMRTQPSQVAGNLLPFLGTPRQAGDLGMLGPYRIEAELGRGGMGIVFRGYDEALQRVVAIKVLRPELNDATSRARFVREAQAAARLHHDHVVGVHAVADPPDGLPYFIMEYLAGQTLAARIRAEQRLEPRAAAEVIAQVADGLAAAHAAGLVHRDIKPANILFAADTGRARIVDFGLARHVAESSGLTQEGALAGTPAYMSPEQVRGTVALDARTDIYSLGVTLYEALTGELPFRGAPHMVMQQVLHDEPRPPRRLNDRVPRDLETICLRAMAREPGRRYPTAVDLAADLRRWLHGEPIRARPVGPLGRGWLWCRRQPVVTVLVGALIVIFLSGFGGVLWEWRRAEVNLRESLRQQDRAAKGALYASEAVRRFHTQVSEERLLNEPGLQPLRRELLQTALDFYQRFVAELGDAPEARADVALALGRLAALHRDIDSLEQALPSAQQAADQWADLVRDQPGNAEHRRHQAENWQFLGGLYRMAGQSQAAERALQDAVTAFTELAAASPNDTSLQQARAAALADLALLYRTVSQPDKAATALDQAQRIRMALAATHPEDPATQRSLASGHLQEGAMHLEARRLAQAEQSFRDALAIQERLAADQPRLIDLQRDLAATFLNLGVVSTRSGDLAKARAAYGSARTIWQKLVDESPSVTAYSYYLCLLDNDLGLVHQMTGDLEQATAAFSQSLERSKKLTHDHPRVVVFFTVRAMAEYNPGNLSRDTDQLTAALDWYATAERTVTEVLRQEPHQVEAVMVLWSIYGARAVALDQAGRHREALVDWDRCANDEKSFLHHLLRFGRAMSLADRDGQPLGAAALADHVRVTAEAQMFVEQFSPPSGILYMLARALVLCRQGAAQDQERKSEERDRLVETYAVRAVEWLVRARTAGYFRFPKNRERLLHEKDFGPLRPRPDFQKLLDGL